MKKRRKFYGVLGTIGILSGLGQWMMMSFAAPAFGSYWVLALLMLAPFLFMIPNMLGDKLPQALSRSLAHIGGYWFMFCIYMNMFLVAFVILQIVLTIMGNERVWLSFSEYGAWTAIIAVAVLLPVGAYRASHPVMRRITIHTDKNLKRKLTIAFASDLHLGMALGKNFCSKLVERFNEINADVVILGGDIIDGNWRFVEREGSLEPFRHLKATLGSFAVLGNHDYYGCSIPQENKALESYGVKCLMGETVLFDEGLQITGLEDYLYFPYKALPEPSCSHFAVLAEHEPKRIMQAASLGYDLYLAGHTHAGQFWPLRVFTRKMFLLDYGLKQFEQMQAIVTSGYGSWGTLFRLTARPEIVIASVEN